MQNQTHYPSTEKGSPPAPSKSGRKAPPGHRHFCLDERHQQEESRTNISAEPQAPEAPLPPGVCRVGLSHPHVNVDQPGHIAAERVFKRCEAVREARKVAHKLAGTQACRCGAHACLRSSFVQGGCPGPPGERALCGGQTERLPYPRNGGKPHSRMYVITPAAQMSTLRPYLKKKVASELRKARLMRDLAERLVLVSTQTEPRNMKTQRQTLHQSPPAPRNSGREE